MKRWLSVLLTMTIVAGAGVLGASTLAGAHHVDCTANPGHVHCQGPGNVPGANPANPKACQGPAATHNPHCASQPAGPATTTTTSGGGGNPADPGGSTTPSTPTQVAGVTVNSPGVVAQAPSAAAPQPAAPAQPTAETPRFTG